MNIYVGNLAHDVTEDDLREAFEAFGQVTSASVIKDKFTHESRGFRFVEMPSASESKAAITGLNGAALKGRTLNVNEARPRTDSRSGGGSSGGHKGGSGGYRGGSGGSNPYRKSGNKNSW